MPSCIRRVAKFLNKPITDDQVVSLSDYLSFNKFKNNKSVSSNRLPEFDVQGEEPCIRKGNFNIYISRKYQCTFEYYMSFPYRQSGWMAQLLRCGDDSAG